MTTRDVGVPGEVAASAWSLASPSCSHVVVGSVTTAAAGPSASLHLRVSSSRPSAAATADDSGGVSTTDMHESSHPRPPRCACSPPGRTAVSASSGVGEFRNLSAQLNLRGLLLGDEEEHHDMEVDVDESPALVARHQASALSWHA